MYCICVLLWLIYQIILQQVTTYMMLLSDNSYTQNIATSVTNPL